MPTAWPSSIYRVQAPRKADVLLDTTCFSSADLDKLSDFDTESDSDTDDDFPVSFFDLANPTKMTKGKNPESQGESSRRKGLSNDSLNTAARYNHPTFPAPSFLTTLLQPNRFKDYIASEFPAVTLKNQSLSEVETTNQESLRKEVNATIANSLLNAAVPTNLTTLEYECWDQSLQRFSNFPETTIKKTVQDWLNHLAHTLGVKHGLIQKVSEQPEEGMSESPKDNEEVDNGAEIGDASDANFVGVEGVTLDNFGVKQMGFVVANAQDRSFSMVSHSKGPSGGYRLCKPDLILVNRNLRHFLQEHSLCPRWHHVEAISEVSSSAPCESMITQIVEKASLMFETQAFRRFAIGLAFRGNAKKLEFCFVLVDRSGVCITPWTPCVGYEGISLARIIFALSYAKPELLGIDTSMKVDLLSGNVISIKVEDQEFNVVKHIHTPLVLFSRGTHVFLVRAKDGSYHILKDAWLLVAHGISEIDVLSHINAVLENDSSDEAKTYRSMHPRFIVGQELGDSTKDRRGRMTDKPPDHVHRRVVTGPVGDPLTSFRSREEFVQVILDCVKWLEFLHNKCMRVHGDLSINNIVIYRSPLARPPSNASDLNINNTKRTNLKVNMTRRATLNVVQQQQALIVPAPLTGLDESIPVVGTVIDYDYARPVNTVMDRTSGTLPFMPLAALDTANRGKYTHSLAHDLESLLQTVIGIVSFTNGPCGNFRNSTEHVAVSRWYNEIDREQLFKDKAIDLLGYDREIDGYLTEYWKPFSPYLRRLVSATWPDNALNPSRATHQVYKNILQEALKAFKTLSEVPAKYATSSSQKRARASDYEEGRYPYKYRRGGSPSSQRLPRPIDIKELSQWEDSINA